MQIRSIGIDLGTTTFHLVAARRTPLPASEPYASSEPPPGACASAASPWSHRPEWLLLCGHGLLSGRLRLLLNKRHGIGGVERV